MSDSSRKIGERIRAARRRLGLSQTDVASKAGFGSHQIVSQIETGEREVKAVELSRLAQVLKVPIQDLLVTEERQAPLVYWRDEPSKAGDQEARLLALCRAYHSARRALRESDWPNMLPSVDLDLVAAKYKDIDRIALDVARTLELGSRPAANLAATLENRYEVLVCYDSLSDGGSAACTRGEYGDGILINADEAPWRRNYDLAHELFHLVTWDSTMSAGLVDSSEAKRKLEIFANHFAASLLLPADELKSSLSDRCSKSNEVDHADLVAIARDFGTSTEALLWRMLNLHWIRKEDVDETLADPQLKRLDRSQRRGSWQEPPPLPDRFVRTVFLAYVKGVMSRARLATCLETNLIGLDDRLAEFGLEDGDYHQRIACAG